MIFVDIYQDDRGKITSFTMSGHAKFGKRGQDIVCAGASAVAIGSINAVTSLTGIKLDVEQTESGVLSCTIPEGLPAEKYEKIQLLLEGMSISLLTIELKYENHIDIIFKNRG